MAAGLGLLLLLGGCDAFTYEDSEAGFSGRVATDGGGSRPRDAAVLGDALSVGGDIGANPRVDAGAAEARPPGDGAVVGPGDGGAPGEDARVRLDAGSGAPDGELRGLWVTRFAWRDQPGLEGIIDRAADAGFNAVFVQIRAEGDAYYRSTHEPWSDRLAGALGRDPGWDPLQVALDRAHARGLELHAYFNAFSAWGVGRLPVPRAEGVVQHPLVAHPEWAAVNAAGEPSSEEYVWFTPGDPAYRAHVVATAEELLTRYAVDGLHLDRVRTSGRAFSYDAATRAAFEAAQPGEPGLTLDAFVRRHMVEGVNALVRDLYAAIGRARPSVKLSAAVWGIYTRASLGDCQGGVSQGLPDYDQDSLAWLRDGYIDALAPMMYWPLAPERCTDWARLLDVFQQGRGGRQIWAGMHALDITNGNAWDFPGLAARVAHGRSVGAAGTVLFASSYLDEVPARWSELRGTPEAPGPFARDARPPAMPWK